MQASKRLAIQDAILETKDQVRRIVVALVQADGHGVVCECTVCDAITSAYKAMTLADNEAQGLDDDDDEE